MEKCKHCELPEVSAMPPLFISDDSITRPSYPGKGKVIGTKNFLYARDYFGRPRLRVSECFHGDCVALGKIRQTLGVSAST